MYGRSKQVMPEGDRWRCRDRSRRLQLCAGARIGRLMLDAAAHQRVIADAWQWRQWEVHIRTCVVRLVQRYVAWTRP